MNIDIERILKEGEGITVEFKKSSHQLPGNFFETVCAFILIHREYTNAFPTIFCIYKNYVEAKNANKPRLHGNLTPKNLLPFPKNPTIAQIFTQMGRSEELGTGIRNVYKYSKAYSGSDKVLFSEEDIFITQVPLDNSVLNGGLNGVTENVTENRIDRILKIIGGDNKITTSKIAKIIGVTRMTISRDIEFLKLNKRILRIGPNKGGYWKVIKKE